LALFPPSWEKEIEKRKSEIGIGRFSGEEPSREKRVGGSERSCVRKTSFVSVRVGRNKRGGRGESKKPYGAVKTSGTREKICKRRQKKKKKVKRNMGGGWRKDERGGQHGEEKSKEGECLKRTAPTQKDRRKKKCKIGLSFPVETTLIKRANKKGRKVQLWRSTQDHQSKKNRQGAGEGGWHASKGWGTMKKGIKRKSENRRHAYKWMKKTNAGAEKGGSGRREEKKPDNKRAKEGGKKGKGGGGGKRGDRGGVE